MKASNMNNNGTRVTGSGTQGAMTPEMVTKNATNNASSVTQTVMTLVKDKANVTSPTDSSIRCQKKSSKGKTITGRCLNSDNQGS